MFDLANIEKNTGLEHIDFHRTLGSTNDRAIELIGQGWRAPGLVLTETQTQGRGRGSNQWWSGNGSLTFSLVYDLAHFKERLPLAPIIVAVCVAESIEAVSGCREVEIKWPNDIMVGSRKLAGILVEAKSNACVFGIGINVNNEQLPNSTSAIHQATSLLQWLGKPTSLEELLIETINVLERNLNPQCDLMKHADSIVQRYNRRLAFGGESIRIRKPDSSLVTGICKGVGSNGALLLETDHGPIEIFSGTIEAV